MYKKVLAIFIFVTLLSACGGSAASTAINVTMTEFSFMPNTLTVPAGQEITFHAVNNGAIAHQFIIMKYGVNVGADFDPENAPNIYWKVQLDPGKEVTAKFIAPVDLGDYQLVCGIKGHFTAGMVGKMTVVAGQ